jgi:hypothetical protein
MSAPRRERNGADQASRLSREEATWTAEMAASVPSPSASPRTGPIRGGGCGRKLGVDILVAHSTAGYGTINGAVAGLSVGDRIAVTDDEADTLEGCSMNCLSPPNRSPRTPRAALPCSGPGPTSSCPTVVCSWPPNRQTPRWPLLTVASPMLRLNVDWSPETNDRCLLKRLARQGRWARGEVSSPLRHVKGPRAGRRRSLASKLIGSPGIVAGIGSVLLWPELLSKPLRDGATSERAELGALLGRLELSSAVAFRCPLHRATSLCARSATVRHYRR